ncbi:hypothetical protein [Candidatus Nanosynbacter lyticus]|uniref:hypothetical protein n=1 Tax=Candidatus Nanosynbacter lyticus TaxID=2093824 RepID=UPI002555D809|nr:hypothetical protein [Candidatus Nanosynbacter lyticus]WLD46649.1 hypothetical protein NLML1_0268 [Candidatus Nanosynbacter lyticus]
MSELCSSRSEQLELSAPQKIEEIIDLERPSLEFPFQLTLEGYFQGEGVNERKDLVEHAERTMKLVEEFAGLKLPPEAIHAVLLHDVADRFHNRDSQKCTPERRQAAGLALADVFTNPEIEITDSQGLYIASLLVDFILVEEASGQHRLDVANAIPESIREIITDRYEGAVPAEAWRQIEPFVDVEQMAAFLDNTNIEAVIIKACELLDNMRYPSSSRESAKLQDVLEAESFYAPLCEVMGFDGLAASLRSQAHIIRLKGQGKHELVKDIREQYETIRRAGVRNLVSAIFDAQIITEAAVGPRSEESCPNRSVHIGDFVAQNGKLVYGKYRLKTVGSWAAKVHEARQNGKPEYTPMDVLGLTVISKNVKAQAHDFVKFLERIDTTPVLDLKKAASKSSAICVHGTVDYVTTVRQEMEQRGFDIGRCEFMVQDDESVKQRGQKYQVSKVTFLMDYPGLDKGVPVEVQFVTEDERRRSRTGEVAHIIYKYIRQLEQQGSVPDKDKHSIAQTMSQLLRQIHQRRDYASHDLMVNERSTPARDAFLEDLWHFLQHELA